MDREYATAGGAPAASELDRIHDRIVDDVNTLGEAAHMLEVLVRRLTGNAPTPPAETGKDGPTGKLAEINHALNALLDNIGRVRDATGRLTAIL